MLFENAFKVYDTESLVVVIKQSGNLFLLLKSLALE